MQSRSMGNHSRVVAHCAENIEERMGDVKNRYGFYPKEKWDNNLKLKKHFEEKMGKNIYHVVEKDTFKP